MMGRNSRRNDEHHQRGMEMADTKIVMLCAHCGKQAVFEVRAEGTQCGISFSQALKEGYDGVTVTT
jgi:hypothetical protein